MIHKLSECELCFRRFDFFWLLFALGVSWLLCVISTLAVLSSYQNQDHVIGLADDVYCVMCIGAMPHRGRDSEEGIVAPALFQLGHVGCGASVCLCMCCFMCLSAYVYLGNMFRWGHTGTS